MCHVIARLQNSDVLSVCGRSCISYGLIQIVRDVTSCSFFYPHLAVRAMLRFQLYLILTHEID